MGWLWLTPTAPSSLEKTSSTAPQSTAEPTDKPSNTPPTKTLSRDEVADKEFQSFLNELEADIQPSSKRYNRVPRLPPTSSQSHPSTSSNGNEPLSEQLLPTTMSCRNAFDAAFYCNSFGGRFNDLYRYGTLRSCSESWNDFWFCMKTRSYSGEQKETVIKEHYRRKESVKYGEDEGQGSSEDVWRSRDRKVAWGEAFKEGYEEFRGSDEEWNRKERERRRGIVDGSMG